MELTGRAALVTGAARGIGKAIAKALAQEGAEVALLDIDESEVRANHGGNRREHWTADLAVVRRRERKDSG